MSGTVSLDQTAASAFFWSRWKATIKPQDLLVLPACIFLAGALLLPLAYMISFSFHPPQTGATELSGPLTLANYLKVLTDGFYLGILGRTVLTALISTTICAVCGYVLAFFLWNATPTLRAIGTVIVLVPLLISIVARTYGWMLIIGDNGVINNALVAAHLIDKPIHIMFTQTAVIIGLVHVFMPFMVLSILTSLERVDPALGDAAKTLGATPFQAVRLVLIPLSLPGLAAGTTIVFSLSMSAYVTPALMGGSRSDTLTTLIYQQFVVVYNWNFGATLVVLLLSASLILVGLIIHAIGRRTRAWMVKT